MPAVKTLTGSAGQWNVTVKVYEADGTTLATVYADANGDAAGANPLPGQRAQGDFGVDTSGDWTCWLTPGDYQIGVRPHGGSETKTPVTVAADVDDPVSVLGLVHGPRADGDVPVWNESAGRLEWAASGGSVTARMAVYQDTSMAAANPTLTVSSAHRHDADTVDCEINADQTNQIDVLVGGVFSVSYHAEVFGASATGGTVVLRASRAGEDNLQVDAEGAVDGSGEYDATVTLANIPMSAGDSFTVVATQAGGAAAGPGNLSRVVVTVLG